MVTQEGHCLKDNFLNHFSLYKVSFVPKLMPMLFERTIMIEIDAELFGVSIVSILQSGMKTGTPNGSFRGISQSEGLKSPEIFGFNCGES